MVEPRRPYPAPRRRQNPLVPGKEVTEVNTPESNNPTMTMGPRRGYGTRPRNTFNPLQQTVPVPDTQKTQPQIPTKKPNARQDSFLEAFIKFLNSLLKFKGK